MKRTRPVRKRKAFAPQCFQLAKGLDDLEAYRRAKRRATRDFRGFNYNPATGKATLI